MGLVPRSGGRSSGSRGGAAPLTWAARRVPSRAVPGPERKAAGQPEPSGVVQRRAQPCRAIPSRAIPSRASPSRQEIPPLPGLIGKGRGLGGPGRAGAAVTHRQAPAERGRAVPSRAEPPVGPGRRQRGPQGVPERSPGGAVLLRAEPCVQPPPSHSFAPSATRPALSPPGAPSAAVLRRGIAQQAGRLLLHDSGGLAAAEPIKTTQRLGTAAPSARPAAPGGAAKTQPRCHPNPKWHPGWRRGAGGLLHSPKQEVVMHTSSSRATSHSCCRSTKLEASWEALGLSIPSASCARACKAQ